MSIICIGTQSILLIFLHLSLLIHSALSLCCAFCPYSVFQYGYTSVIDGEFSSFYNLHAQVSVKILAVFFEHFILDILGFPFFIPSGALVFLLVLSASVWYNFHAKLPFPAIYVALAINHSHWPPATVTHVGSAYGATSHSHLTRLQAWVAVMKNNRFKQRVDENTLRAILKSSNTSTIGWLHFCHLL
jgi:hypothetical protein